MHFFFLPHYATVYRHVFVPTIYAWKGVHPLELREAENKVGDLAAIPSFHQVKWEEVLSKYDYVWGYKLSEESKRLFLLKGELVAEVNEAMLFRIRKT